MTTVNIYEARSKLAELVNLAASGTDVVIARRGYAVARITRLQTGKRPILTGLMEGQGWIADDFDGPMPDKSLAKFMGRP
jgi:antitoxin (DNA-binding transcriptional repressor) of toxin-antitoxin stability system